MHLLPALMVLSLEAAATGRSLPALREEALSAAARQVLRPPALAISTPPREGRDGEPPPCLGDVCQPQVSVPGYGSTFNSRGARTRLVLEALDTLRLEPVATVAWWLASTGVRLDYTPASSDSAVNGGMGVARYRIALAWRTDAWLSPDWLQRRR